VHAAITATRAEAAGAAGGPLPGPFDAMLRAPRSGGALAALGDALRRRGVLPDRVRELAVLQVAAHEDSAFEWAAHAPIAAALGWSGAVLDAVRAGEVPPGLDDPAERAAHAAVAALLATGDLGAGDWADLLGGLGEAGAVELLTLVGYYRLLALQMRVLRIG
jgi:4-carboxymuconolactone decarboxylase